MPAQTENSPRQKKGGAEWTSTVESKDACRQNELQLKEQKTAHSDATPSNTKSRKQSPSNWSMQPLRVGADRIAMDLSYQ